MASEYMRAKLREIKAELPGDFVNEQWLIRHFEAALDVVEAAKRYEDPAPHLADALARFDALAPPAKEASDGE